MTQKTIETLQSKIDFIKADPEKSLKYVEDTLKEVNMQLQMAVMDLEDWPAPGIENGKKLWCAVALDTPHGDMPGKARDGYCWYSCTQEHKVRNFRLVLSENMGKDNTGTEA